MSLSEHRENGRHHVGGQPDPRIADAHLAVTVVGACLQSDRAARLGVLARVVQHVIDDLQQARGVALDPQGVVTQVDREDLATLLDERTNVLCRRVQQLRHVDRLVLQFDDVARDTTQVEDVVQKSRQVRGLSFDRLARPLQRPRIGIRPQQRRRVADRSERVAQFVGKRHQKLVLLPIRGFERELRLLEFRDVDMRADRAADAPIR